MKLITVNACVAGFIQVTYKGVHQIEKLVFMGIFVAAVKPVNHITSEQFIVRYLLPVTGTSRLKLVSGKKANEVLLQVCGKGTA